MYLIYKIISYMFFLGFLFSLSFIAYLLIKGKSETGKQAFVLMCVFVPVVPLFICSLIFSGKAFSVYKQAEISQSRVFDKCGVFAGMADGRSIKHGAPKDAYANFIFDDGSFHQAGNYEVIQKAKLFNKGVKVCVKYINAPSVFNNTSGFYKKNIIVIDVNKLSSRLQ